MDTQIIAFTVAAALLTIAPGPDNMLVVRNALRGGRRDGFLTGLGVCAGLFVHATLSACGLSVLLTQSAAAFHLLKLAGAGYLLWLGAKSLRSVARPLPSAPESAAPVPQPGAGALGSPGASARQCLLEGFLSNVLNPKTAVFYLAFLPQFIRPADPVLTRSLLLAGIHYMEGILWFLALATLLDQVRRVFLHSAFRRFLDALCGSLLIAFGARLALARR